MKVWFRKQLKRNWFLLTIIFILNIIGMSFNIVLPLCTRYLIDNILVNKNMDILMKFSSLIIILFIISNLLDFIAKRLYCNIILGLKKNLKETIFNHVQRIKLGDFISRSKGDYIATIVNDSEAVIQIFNDYLYPSALSVISLVIVIGILLNMNIGLTIICILSIPIFIITSKYFGSKIKQIAYEIRKDIGKHMEVLDEGLSLIVTNKLYNYYDKQEIAYKTKIDSLMKNSYSLFINNMYSKQIFTFTASVFPIIILIQGGYKIVANEITIGTIVAFISYLAYLYTPVTLLSNFNMAIKEIKASVKRVEDILNLEKENLLEYRNKCNKAVCDGDIEFNNIRYSIDNKIILDGMSFSINQGELVAIIGGNGAGKSTLINLLLRLYDFEGDILINNISIKEMDIADLRNSIALVPQKGALYANSIKENINMAKPSASDEEIREVLELVNLNSFIDSLENGLETKILGNEVNLSGGEKQKILCARAFLKPSNILVLDEALNAIDIESKKTIMESIVKMKGEKTIIMITHNSDELEIADRVIKINN